MRLNKHLNKPIYICAFLCGCPTLSFPGLQPATLLCPTWAQLWAAHSAGGVPVNSYCSHAFIAEARSDTYTYPVLRNSGAVRAWYNAPVVLDKASARVPVADVVGLLHNTLSQLIMPVAASHDSRTRPSGLLTLFAGLGRSAAGMPNTWKEVQR